MGLLVKVKSWFHKFSSSTFQSIENMRWEKTSDISYRFAVSKDINALLAVERDVFADIPWTYSHFRNEIVDNKRAGFIVAEKFEEIVGYIGFRWTWQQDELHISNFVIKKSFQKQGIGSSLLNHLLEITKIFHISKISLEVNRENQLAQAFYRKKGFETSKILSHYYNDGRDAIEMLKELENAANENH